MKAYAKIGLTIGALAMAMLAVVQTASAQAPRASDKARGYYGPAASVGPSQAFWLAPGVTSEDMFRHPMGPGVASTRARSFSYAPAPAAPQPATPAPAAPRAQSAAPAPAPAPAVAPATPAPRRYSYSYQPRYYSNMTMDRVLGNHPENRNAAAKAQGEY
ncbi:MAG TPA: hypothetical protein VMF30_08425 [Pirellulales bacterium]|nr:hypothetical protein [Pirellulales bacterium]